MTWKQTSKRRGWPLLPLGALLWALPAAAQTAVTDDDLVEQVLDAQGLSKLSLEQLLETPVVTASGREEERSLAAANVFVVTREEIERRGYRSLAEILRRAPGIYLVDDYVNPSIGVREVTGGYRGGTRVVKIMIDGFPVSFRPDLEAFLGPEFIPMEAVERVEVAKGPLSALYGANAFLATVNVITREPEDRALDIAQRYRVTSGNPGYGTSALAMTSTARTGLLLSASFDHFDRSGVLPRTSYEAQDPEAPVFRRRTEDDISRPITAFGRFDLHDDSFGDFRLEAGHQELDAKGEFLLNSVLTHRSRVHLINRWLNLAWQRKIQRLSLRAYVGTSHGETGDNSDLFLTGNTSASYRPQYGYDALNGLFEASYDFGSFLQLDLGVDGETRDEGVLHYRKIYYSADPRHRPLDEEDLLNPGDPRELQATQVGTYLQLHSTPIASVPDFRLTGSARGDVIDFGPISYPYQTSFRGAVAYRVSPLLTTKLIAGKAFQAPSGTLLFAHGGFGNTQNVVGTQILDATTPLRPQVVTSAELVASSQVSDFLSLEGSVYYQDLEDAIRFYQVGSIIVAKNAGKVESAGAELTANLHWGRFRPYASVSIAKQLSVELTRELAGIISEDGAAPMYPRAFGHAGLDVELVLSQLYLNAELRWAGPRGASQGNFYQNNAETYELSAYRELDVTLSTGGLPLLDPELKTSFLVSVRNLTGTERLEPGFAGIDIPQPATNLFVQVKQAL
jgi:outer membrane receptor protein involved in Fe transport